VLIQSPYVSELIAKGDIAGIKEAMGHSTGIGMCTFDQSLYNLYVEERISKEEALLNADSARTCRCACGLPPTLIRTTREVWRLTRHRAAPSRRRFIDR